MSALLARALAAAELDLLVLGALADRLREAERGPIVRVHVERALVHPTQSGDPSTAAARAFGREELAAAGDGHAFLRAIAIARLTGPRAASLIVDADEIGLPLAQVALTFGADELVASVREGVGKRSLQVYGGDDAGAREREVLRERELCALIRAAGRTPRVVDRSGEREPDESTHAVRRFRAPGREASLETGEA